MPTWKEKQDAKVAKSQAKLEARKSQSPAKGTNSTAAGGEVVFTDDAPLAPGEGIKVEQLARLVRMLYEATLGVAANALMKQGLGTALREMLTDVTKEDGCPCKLNWESEAHFRPMQDATPDAINEFYDAAEKALNDINGLQGPLIQDFLQSVLLRFLAGFTDKLTVKHMNSLFIPFQAAVEMGMCQSQQGMVDIKTSWAEKAHLLTDALFMWIDSDSDDSITKKELVGLVVNIVQSAVKFEITAMEKAFEAIPAECWALGPIAMNLALKKMPGAQLNYSHFKEKAAEFNFEEEMQKAQQGKAGLMTYPLLGVNMMTMQRQEFEKAGGIGMLKQQIPPMIFELVMGNEGLLKSLQATLEAKLKEHTDDEGCISKDAFDDCIEALFAEFGTQFQKAYPVVVGMAPPDMQQPAMMAGSFVHIPEIIKSALSSGAFRRTADALFKIFAADGKLKVERIQSLMSFLLVDVTKMEGKTAINTWMGEIIPKLLGILDVDHDQKLSPLEIASFARNIAGVGLAFACDVQELLVLQIMPKVLTGGIDFALAQKEQFVSQMGGIEKVAQQMAQMMGGQTCDEEFVNTIKELKFPLKKPVVDQFLHYCAFAAIATAHVLS